MIWIIASMPFWIIGAGFFAVGCVGIGAVFRGAGTMADADLSKSAIGILLLMAGAGVTFLIAAKICS